MSSTCSAASAVSASDSKEPECEPSPSARLTRIAKLSSESTGQRCPHKYEESESAVYTEGLCPLCLAADNNRLRVALEKMADPLTLDVYGTGTQRALKIIEAMRAIAKEALEN